jgi:glycosyltransferase involved in cell wall biosynthesis
MIKGKDIVIIGIQPWDIEIGSNCKNIASQFAKENRVLYVNPPLDRITKFKKRKDQKIQKRIAISKGLEPDLVQLEENLWNLFPKDLIESINWISSNSLFRKLNHRNSRIFADNINTALERLGFKDIILFNDSSMFLGRSMKEFLKPKHYCYYMRDFLIEVPYWRKHGSYMEPELMKEVDLIINNSSFYAEYSSKFNENSVMVGQGCDLDLFVDPHDTIKVPADLIEIKGPRIGYVGSLTTLRLDIDILEYIATQRSDWNIVLVGPEDNDFKKSRLHELPNVYFLGNKDSKSLPAYIKGFDVAINPQVVNDITIGNYPRKIDEYLALGKPIVATYTKAMEMFSDYVYLCTSKEEYIRLIEHALDERSKQKSEKRIEFAKDHTWEKNVAAIYHAIDKSIEKNNYAIKRKNPIKSKS